MTFYDIYAMVVIILCGFIPLIFFNSLFNRVHSLKSAIFVNIFLNCILALIYLIKTPTINLLAFLVANILFANIMYDCTKKSSVLYSFILGAVMMLSEFFVVIILHFGFNIEVDSITDEKNIILFTLLSKSFYLLVVLIAKKVILKNKDGCLYDNTYYFFLSFPIATMILLSGLYFVVYKLSDKESLVVMLSVIPLIVSEFVCYLVYDYIIEKNRNINLLQEEIYKTKLQIKEYDLYKQKYESSRIIMHDIKKHLGIIRNLGTNSERANKYIDDYLTKNDDKIIYTNNEVLNVILNEKATECKQKNIDFSINVSTNKINILSDNDIVTIFCNLIDNAIESCLNSNNKRILVDIYLTNGIFLTVNMVNSCDVPPKYRNNKLISSKKDVNNHGLGMLSIEKSINNCGGDIQYAYNSEEKTFSVTILINTKL